MPARPRPAALLAMTLTGALLLTAALVAGFMYVTSGPHITAPNRPRVAAVSLAGATRSATESADAAFSLVPKAATLVIPPQGEVRSLPATEAARAAAGPAAKPSSAVRAGPSLDAYRGLGSWVDIYDDGAWNDPAGTVRDMAGRGVRTLYIETANSRSPYAIKDAEALRTFIREAHAHRMRIVAWYLPDMRDVSMDYDRIAQAIRFRTADGQGFDSFALDIESSAVGSVTARNRALDSLSQKIRSLVGRNYPLGAIIPSPVGMAKNGSWRPFPYTMLAKRYDVFVPMSYYTYHGSGFTAAYADTRANVRILRAQPGCSKTPIHLIGGISENSTIGEVEAFVRAARETGVFGASLYAWTGTSPAHWQKLSALRR